MRPIIIGIAGGSAAGKTTLSKLLEERLQPLPVKLLHGDRYFKSPLPKTIAPFTGREYDDYNHPDSLHMDQLCADLLLARQEPVAVIIVEGLLVLQHEPLRPLLDLKLFVDCRHEERAVRRLRRNMSHGLAFDEIADVMLDSVRYRHDEFVEPSRWYADMVVNGSAMPEAGIALILAWIERRLDAERQ